MHTSKALPSRGAVVPNRAVIDGIRRLDRGLRLAARQVQGKTGLSAAQLFVLERLADAPALSLASLAARTLTDRSSVSVAVDRLETEGLVARRSSENDRRRSEVRITASGRAVLRDAPMPPTDMLISALARLPRGTVRSLASALQSLNHELGFKEAALLFADDD